MHLRPTVLAALLLLPFAPAPARAADLPMTAEEFGLWRDYQGALTDARVQKMPEKQRLPAIAKNFQANEKKLRDAVEKGEKYGEGIAQQVQESTKAALAASELAARIKEIKVDASAAHVVAYLTWTAATPEAVDKEACLAAVTAVKANPLVATLKLDVRDPSDDKKSLFEALISRANAQRIQEDKIVDFASTRYLRLFEKVKRVP